MSSKSFQNASKLNGIVSVLQFGAVGDFDPATGLGTDNTAAIQAAIDAAQSAGGFEVSIPSGIYKISSGLTISSPISLVGYGVAVIAPNFATGDALTLNSVSGNYSGVVISNVSFDAPVVRTAGYYINVSSSFYTEISGCNFKDHYNGIGLTGAATAGFRVRDCFFNNGANSNIIIAAATGTQGTTDIVIQDVLFAGTNVGSQTNSGITILSAGDIELRHVSTVWSGVGLNVSVGAGNVVQSLVVDGCYFDSGSGSGISLVTASTGEIQRALISNTWSATNSSFGILIDGTNVKHTDIVSCTASNNGNIGIYFSKGSNVHILGGSVSANTSHGISIAANQQKFSVIGTTIGATGQFAGNGGWGIVINGGTTTNFVIANCSFFNNTTGSIVNGSAFDAVRLITNCVGYVSSNSGYATASAGVTQISVSHGLSVTPENVVISPSGQPEAADWYVGAVTSTTFTIHIGATTTTTRHFYWKASVTGI